jgi:hypothetical protein
MSRKDRVLVVDYNQERREHLKNHLLARFPEFEVYELKTDPPQPKKNLNTAKLQELGRGTYDILIGHIGGNPSGYECLQTFKKHNPKGKVVLYTKQDMLPIEKFDGLKLANKVFRRAEDDTIVFPSDDEMFAVIENLKQESGLIHWKSPFKDSKVIVVIISLLTAVIGLISAVVKLF